jgi:plastocyanin
VARVHRAALLFGLAVALATAAPAGAASTNILVGQSFYDPQTVTITAGDTVTWSNGQGRHTITSDTGAFDSGPLAEGQSFSFQFSAAGTYPYRDRLNPGGARGTIIVQALDNAPPVASFGATPSAAPAGTAIAFDASASLDPDGSIAHYRWDFDGDGVYETDTGTQPRVARAFPTAGTIPVGLLVEDNRGSSGVATPVAVTITPAPAATDQTPPDLTYLGMRPQVLHAGTRATVRLVVGERSTLRLSLSRSGRHKVLRRWARRAVNATVAVSVSTRGLAPGSYRLTIVAVDRAGNRSVAVRPRFRVVSRAA